MSAAPATAAPAWQRPGAALAMVALVILLGNVGLIFLDVLARWLLRAPQSWVSDIGQITYPVAIACCFPAALESGHMIAIRFLGEWLGPRRARPLDVIGQVALAALLVLFTWKMFQRAHSDWTGGFRTANISLRTAPTWFVVAALLGLCVFVQARVVWQAVSTPPEAAHG
ncbi:MAG: TRAP transporter small permease [Rubrivivax sp.]|nr:TRAP transporter small permease [Rubrivivax sp.]